MSNEINFDELAKDMFNNGIPDFREDILKSGHYVVYGDSENENIIFIEYPDLERYTLPTDNDYIATEEEIKTRQFTQLIKREKLEFPCYLSEGKKLNATINHYRGAKRIR